MMDNTTPCDDNSLLLTPSQMSCDLFTFVAYVGVLGVMSVFGLIGNTLSFFVLSWERHSHVATFLLQVEIGILYHMIMLVNRPITLYDYAGK